MIHPADTLASEGYEMRIAIAERIGETTRDSQGRCAQAQGCVDAEEDAFFTSLVESVSPQ